MRYLYVLDDQFRRIHVFDQYESLIWTERFNTVGDFELVIHSTFDNRMRLKHDTWLGIDESKRVMIVETIENSVSIDGLQNLTIKGRSLEAILDDKPLLSPLNENFKWGMEGQPRHIAEAMFNDICVDGIVSSNDVLPYYTPGNLFPQDTVPWPLDPISVEVNPGSLYQELHKICEQFNFGFRLYKNGDMSELYFNIYSGVDRTSGQSANTPVVFSPDLDNLQNTRELTSSAMVKNVALVVTKYGSKYVYAPDAESTTSGFDRKVITVWYDDFEGVPGAEELDVILEQQGREALADRRNFIGFDGEIDQYSQYLYGRDYNLGDLVEMRNADGFTNNMRVTEQIFVSDAQGFRSYPTLSLNIFINTGSWLSWERNKTWSEQGPESWSQLP